MKDIKKVVLAGASGLTGSHCLNLLLKDERFQSIESWVRKESGHRHPKLSERKIDFDSLERESMQDTEIVICCLGTTIKKAGNKANFEKVDLEYVEQLANQASASGVSCFIVISSVGANALSSNFYLRTKGRMEESLKKSGIPSILIVRPSMLTGDRKEFRAGERFGILLMKLLDPLMFGSLKKYRSIKSETVATAMLSFALDRKTGIHIMESDELAQYAETVSDY